MIDHIAIDVSDIERSQAFYEGALAPLGMRIHRTETNDAGERVVLMGAETISFAFAKGTMIGTGTHIAFRAADTDQVDAFHAAAIAAGGRDNGKPGLRPRYGGGYYAAFVIDPDGLNVEAVCHLPR